MVPRTVGAQLYLIGNKKGEEHTIHEDRMKPHVEDVLARQPREWRFWKGVQYENQVNTGR